MRYCGIVAGGSYVHLCALEEMRGSESPIRLESLFYEPASPRQVADEVDAFGDAVVAIAAPAGIVRDGQPRLADAELRRRGVLPVAPTPAGRAMFDALTDVGLFKPAAGNGAVEGEVGDGAYETAPVFETNADGVFSVLQGRRMPAKRHPIGIQRRIEILEQHHVADDGGDLWHRRIEEIEAAAAALCAHRYALGHACWVGRPDEGVIVLPGSRLPEVFSSRGVLPPVERVVLPDA